MTEFATSLPDEIEPQGHEVYETNIALYDSLEELKAKAEECTYKEAIWRRYGFNIALIPSSLAATVIVSPLGERMSSDEKATTGVGAFMGSIVLGLLALSRHDSNREKAQETAAIALPVAHALNGRTPLWIEKRLKQKQEDELRAEKNSKL